MGIICNECGRDIDAIGQDNMSCDPAYALCEDCNRIINFDDQCPEEPYEYD